ncbi:hypothetical protein D3C87_1235070 [compost metagenome]
MPGAGRWPRNSPRSMSSARAARVPRSQSSVVARLRRSARRSTGAQLPLARLRICRARRPADAWNRGVPAASSTTMSKRFSSAAMRRARLRSGVTMPTVCSRSSASRPARAMARASSSSLRAWMVATPASASATIASGRRCSDHSAVRAVGASARLTKAVRGWLERQSSVTCPTPAPKRRKSCARPYCGWPWGLVAGSSSASCMSGLMAMSSPGSTTAPRGSSAIALSSRAVAGIEPVEPAAMTGRSPKRKRAALACRSSLRPRRDAASASSWSLSQAGQAFSAISRNCSVCCQ